jgi:5'-3' exonuclease
MNIILVDGSYTSFYRFFATLRWMSIADKDEWNSIVDKKTYDWTKNKKFMDTYSKMYLMGISKAVGSKIFKNSTILFCLDSERKLLWRNELHKHYKEGRVDISKKHKIKPVFNYTYETLLPKIIEDNKNIKSIKINNIEADDIIARISKELKDTEHNVYIISGDDDFTQLCRKNVTICDYRNKPNKILDCEESRKLLIKKIVKGDSSDNIMPIFKGEKISPKLKTELLEDEYKLFDYLNNNPSIMEKYKMNRDLIDFDYMPNNIKSLINKNIKKHINPFVKK